MTDTPHILVVDDHRDIRDGLKRYLEKNGLRVTVAADAIAMDAALKNGAFDLIVLDIMLPGEDGLSICRRLRQGQDIPILMLSALDEDTDRVVGLEVGADDYLPKPFNPRELLARIKAILRRTVKPEPAAAGFQGQIVHFERWALDTDQQTLRAEDVGEILLTTSEFRLLTVFLERPRAVLSREQLLDLTSGRRAQAFDRAIDNQVSRLRRKIERDPAQPEIIKTIWGGGYALAATVTVEA